jgi:hypothetical protein
LINKGQGKESMLPFLFELFSMVTKEYIKGSSSLYNLINAEMMKLKKKVIAGDVAGYRALA